MLAGGLASATQRRTSASLSSSKSISGEPIRRMLGASARKQKQKRRRSTWLGKTKTAIETTETAIEWQSSKQSQQAAPAPGHVLWDKSTLELLSKTGNYSKLLLI